ncbi:PREDICTED: aspartate aminotransferase, mitochondrial-like [Ipomoea nil]|uniref:aspartate aminotransferase, mitochondrial-like n=1 Tax=Ipomoea nil TaxID=35883 RepID=UPI000900865D|nr:PREDICTED: aspartate aminotransferase, mitochondrial-like [Ipomoea nil]
MMTMWRCSRYLGRRRRSITTSADSRAAGGWSWWGHAEPLPKDPIKTVTDAFFSDPSPFKINLFVGTYRDAEGNPVVLECVRKAAAKLAGCEFLDSISPEDSSKLVEECSKLAYGKDSGVVTEGRCAGIPALSGTGACRLFAELQRRFYPDTKIYLPNPTWSNHHNIWRDAEISRSTFRYYHPDTRRLHFQALMEDIKNAPSNSFFLLHPCAHNPTGIDPSTEQWEEISHMFKVKKHFPFFDMAYQGIATGDLERDARAIRIFLKDGHLLACAQSFSKIMGLYGHRVGCLSILCVDDKQASIIKGQLHQIVSAMYSSSPVHGPLLVSTILNDPDLKALWEEELKVMTDRFMTMRAALHRNLEALSSLSWEHIINQVGMFCFSGLSPKQVEQLQKDFQIYMPNNGRISMAGVTSSNVEYLANAMHKVTSSSR